MIVTEDYRRNLDALQQFDPPTASTIEQADFPPSAQHATGRDGNPTFVLNDANGQRQWLGHSSMPSISATETLREFVSSGESTFLPGILTGYEPRVLLDRVPRSAAVFVLETDPRLVKLALCLYDYAEPLAQGRLVLVTAPPADIQVQLVEFFKRHDGFAWPNHLTTVPQWQGRRIADLQQVLRATADQVYEVHQANLNAMQARLARRPRRPLPTHPRLLIATFDTNPDVVEYARAVARAAANLQLPNACHLPTRPGEQHPLKFLEKIDAQDPDVVLVLNADNAAVANLVPAAHLVGWTLAESSPAGRGAAEYLADQPTRLCELELAVDDTTVHTQTGIDRTLTLVLHDLPDDRPHACGIQLVSQTTLLEALTTLAGNAPETSTPEQLLDQAQAETGIELKEASIRDQFITLIKQRITPAAIARACIRALAETTTHVEICGRNWRPEELPDGTTLHGHITTERQHDLLRRAQVTVLLGARPHDLHHALLALVHGSPVLCRTDNPLPPAFDNMVETFRQPRELAEVASARCLNPDHDRIESFRRQVLQAHTVSARLNTIMRALRPCTTAGNPVAEPAPG